MDHDFIPQLAKDLSLPLAEVDKAWAMAKPALIDNFIVNRVNYMNDNCYGLQTD